jgi:hypothetical protein
VPNVGAPNFIKHPVLDVITQTDPNIVVTEDFSTPLSPIDRPPRQKINKETLESNDTIDQIALKDKYKIFYPATMQYTFFLAPM